MSQQVFADRLGKSKSWVDKVERGVRRLDKFSVVYEIADVLQVDVQLLLGKDVERRPETQNCIDQVEVEEIRAALERYDQMSAFFHPVPQRSEEHTSELQSRQYLVCRPLLEKTTPLPLRIDYSCAAPHAPTRSLSTRAHCSA